ncbi:MAG: helix-turn-helix domain-containing protein [Clostridia bacterium]|nr:helix-turn-helix domain-containing protein [Clostridia bacterium]
MRDDILTALSAITDEERALLGGAGIDRRLYSRDGAFVVGRAQMLGDVPIAMRPHTRFVDFPDHRHDFIEIMYMCAGSTRHRLDGATEIVLEAGDLLLLAPQTTHAIACAGEGDVAVNLMLLPVFLEEALGMVGRESVPGRFLLGCMQNDRPSIPYLHAQVGGLAAMQNLLENLIASRLGGGKIRRSERLTMGLILLMLEEHAELVTEGDPTARGNALVEAALQEIHHHYRDASLAALADRYAVSLSYLSRTIHAQTGSTFKELLRARRLERAAELLTATALPLADILPMLGYDNSSYFHRIFRARYGCTPKEYREQIRTQN